MSDTDLELLERYANQNAEDAFSEIVRRHVDLVYSTALRHLRSPEMAEEVSQSVFTQLVRDARRLAPDTILAAWLYKVTHGTALNVVRREARRRLREQIASEMTAMNASTTDWTQIEPLLDEAMHALNDSDRSAVLLRYFENKSLREVGEALGTSDDTAQKRVSRAVDRLREFLAKRGVTIGASGLVVVISANAVQAAPAGLAAAISAGVVLAGTAVSASAISTTTSAVVMSTYQKALITIAVAAGLATPLVIQHRAETKLREENTSLRQQVGQLNQLLTQGLNNSARRSPALSLPAPRVQVAASPGKATTEEVRPTNMVALLQKLQQGDQFPKLTPAQVDSYLKQSGRSASSLLAAFRVTGERTFLEQALQKYPDDPEVSFSALFVAWLPSNGTSIDVASSQEERRQLLEAFKQTAPQNSMANYLSALDYFKSGQTDQAVQELNAASTKQQFQDYSADFVQNDEEAWRSAGYSVAEAKTAASMLLLLPYLGEMKQLTQDTVSLANSYRQAGDEASAQAALEVTLNLGQRLDGSPGQSLLNELVGVAIQSIALRAMDPNSPYGQNGETVQNRLDQLAQQRTDIAQLTSQFDTVQQQVSEQDRISYKDRWSSFGEESALRWLVNKYSQK
jgi:RNA polymerase sigma factor (sigma-70 family)